MSDPPILKTFCPVCKDTREMYFVGTGTGSDKHTAVYECGVCNFIIRITQTEEAT